MRRAERAINGPLTPATRGVSRSLTDNPPCRSNAIDGYFRSLAAGRRRGRTLEKNGSTLRQGSPALAAEFLHEFAGDGPWAHVDMAGPAFLERSRGDYLRVPGGTGYGVRLIAELGRLLT